MRLDGIVGGDFSGYSVSAAGDVNGDGFDDVIIGAYGAATSDAGEGYVVFGKASGWDSSLDLSALDGSTGFRLDAVSTWDRLGRAVSEAGDVNGDGIDDLLIGAWSGSTGYAGESFVVFGKASGWAASLDLSTLDGTTGFRLDGVAAADYSGKAVGAAGDVNGDGFDDILIGAYKAASAAGESYVVFGQASGWAASLDLSDLDGTTGFRIDGIDGSDRSGRSVSGAGDVNGDGIADLIVGAWGASPSGSASGESYVVFGKTSAWAASLDLSTLDGSTGFRLDGIDAADDAGRSVSAAGDVNGDGFDDLMVGAWGGDPDGNAAAGESYVVFGGDFTHSVTHLGSSAADTLTGTSGANVMVGGLGGDSLNGAGGADVLRGGAGDDNLTIADLSFQRLDGGSDSDTLTLGGSGQSLDLTTTSNLKITSIETIDISGSGANTLTLELGDVLDISESVISGKTRLLVDGGADDTVTATDSWTSGGATTVSGNDYNVYTSGNAQLLIDTDIGTQTIPVP